MKKFMDREPVAVDLHLQRNHPQISGENTLTYKSPKKFPETKVCVFDETSELVYQNYAVFSTFKFFIPTFRRPVDPPNILCTLSALFSRPGLSLVC